MSDTDAPSRRLGGFLATNHPGVSLLLVLAVTVLLGAGLTRAELAESLGGFRETSSLNDLLVEVEQTFDDNANVRRLQVLVDAGLGGDAISAEGFEAASEAARRLRAVLAGRPDVTGRVVSYLQLATSPGDADAAFLAGLGADDRLAQLVSRDLALGADSATARVGLVLVVFDAGSDDGAVDDVVIEMDEALEGASTSAVRVLPFEEEIVNVTIRDDTRREPPKLAGIGFLLLLAVLAATYRSPTQVALSLVGVALAVVWAMGAAAWMGPNGLGWVGGFSPMSLNTPMILLGLAVDYGIQLNTRYSEERLAGAEPAESAGTAVRSTGGALVLTTLTTMVGFGAGAISPIAVISDFAVILAVGVAAGFGVMVGLVPAARHLIDRRRLAKAGPDGGLVSRGDRAEEPMARIGALVARLTGWSTDHAAAVTAVVVVVLAAGSWAATHVRASADRAGFLSPSSPVTETLDLLVEGFGGDLAERTYAVVRGGNAGVDAAIDGFVAGAAGVDGVTTRGATAQARVLGPEGNLRAIELTTTAGELGAPRLAEDLARLTGPIEATGATVELTSENLVSDEVNGELADSGRRSMVIALTGALLVMTVFQLLTGHSVVLGALTVVSSAVVVVLVLGAMFVFDIALNLATITSASLAVGIGIDYSIHLSHRFQEELRSGRSPHDAIDRAATTTGGALLASALTTIVGIGTLALSTVPPIADYGRLNALAIATAFLAALVVQPALLALWARRPHTRI